MKTTLWLLIVLLAFGACKESCNLCQENWMISPDNYDFFLENSDLYKHCKTISISRLSDYESLLNVLENLLNSDSLRNLWISNIELEKVPEITFSMTNLESL